MASEPRTEAGRLFIAYEDGNDEAAGNSLGHLLGIRHWTTRDAILFIDQQAAAQSQTQRGELDEAIRRVSAARFVAEHWRNAYMEYVRQGQSHYGIGTHPLALVLDALDGETDPRDLGLSETEDQAFAAALARDGDQG